MQGHGGVIAECTSCHTTVPVTANGGPHGMHTIGSSWVGAHHDYAEHHLSECRACHGADYRGTVLSRTAAARSFNAEHGTRSATAGQQVTCYDYNGPNP
ncbi:MAG: hypothetical protein U0325_36485 [Polyangiales bacterium]